MTNAERQKLRASCLTRWFGDQPDGADIVAFFKIIESLNQIADDIADGDSSNVPSDMAVLLDLCVIQLPSNRYYRNNVDFIIPIMSAALLTWDASNVWAKSHNQAERIFAFVRRWDLELLAFYVLRSRVGFERSRSLIAEYHSIFHDGDMEEKFTDWCKEMAA